MSTTWVFWDSSLVEIILHLVTKQDKPYLQTFRQVGKDVCFATMVSQSALGFMLHLLILSKSKFKGSIQNQKIQHPK